MSIRCCAQGIQRIRLAHRETLPADDSNINLLFWGQPGTGKTEFVKFLARESGLS
jgi:MoxR-like ATPase